MRTETLRTVTLGISNLRGVKERARAAFSGKRQGSRIDFASRELLMSVLTDKRWDIIEAMTGAGPISIREVARRVDRDVKAVHGDITALVKTGVLQRSDSGVVFPYDRVHVEFTLPVS